MMMMAGGVLGSRRAYGLTRFLSGRRDDTCDLDRMRDKGGFKTALSHGPRVLQVFLSKVSLYQLS